MIILPTIGDFGEPTESFAVPGGTMLLWSAAPFMISHVEGRATTEMAKTMDAFFRARFGGMTCVVTIHDWSRLTEYDVECRRILQQLAHFTRPKQREIIIHLGPTESIGQKAIRVTTETIARFKKIPIEIFSEDAPFEARIRALLETYPR